MPLKASAGSKGGGRPRYAAWRVAALVSLTAGFVALAAPVANATSSDQAVAYQLDPAHDGYQTVPITAPLSQIWSTTLPGSISYPLIVNGVV